MQFSDFLTDFTSWVDDERPDVVLLPGASREELSGWLARTPAAAGSEILEWFSHVNGEDARYSSLCGGLKRFIDLSFSEDLSAGFLRSAQRQGAERTRMSVSHASIRAVEWDPGWVPFFLDNAAPYCVDLSPADAGCLGQVIYAPRGDNRVHLVAKSLWHFLDRVADGVKLGEEWPYPGLFE